jgi:hypothetical protein
MVPCDAQKPIRANQIDVIVLPWAQEVWSSNLHAPIKTPYVNGLQTRNFDAAAFCCKLGTRRKFRDQKSRSHIA